MPKRSLAEKLDQAVQAMLDNPGVKAAQTDPEIDQLLQVAAELRNLPQEKFKARLKQDLQKQGEISMAATAEPMIAERPTTTPYLTLLNAAEGIEFYKRAFGAKENMRLSDPSGKIAHAEIQIGNSRIMLSDEFPEFNSLSPQTLGGSPIKLHLEVDDVDAFAKRAVEAGGRLVRPIANQFYGYRAGQFADPFGYVWSISTQIEALSLDEIHTRFDKMTAQHRSQPTFELRKGFRAVTSYIVTQDVPSLIEFLEKTFDAEETLRSGPGSQGGMHCEVRIGDSMLMIGGGSKGFAWQGTPRPGAFHIYVPDCDATYKRAMAAGAASFHEPADQPYGERSATVKDEAGNFWYIATFKGEDYKSEGAPTIQPYFHPLRAEPLVSFLKKAFWAKELGRHTSPDGVVQHATISIGDAHMELGEAHGDFQPMASSFMLYVPDVDVTYKRALAVGAKSMFEPAEQPYGVRMGGVTDPFGNQWYIGTPGKQG